MPIWVRMNPLLQRLLGGTPGRNLRYARLQLELLVAMATIDGRVDDAEWEQIEDFIDRAAGSGREHRELHRLLEQLHDAPPDIERVLAEVARHAGKEGVAQRMVHELAVLADADHVLDHRETFLLDLVHDAFELPAAAAGDTEEELDELHELVRRIAIGRGAA